ncbi:MAG: tetratricopeptide repeat protein [Ktedonobacterales bacterium]
MSRLEYTHDEFDTNENTSADAQPNALAGAALALDEGHIDHALPIYRAIAEHAGIEQAPALLGLSVCHARRRQWEDAEAALTRLLELSPESGAVYAYLGSVRLELGSIDEARDDFSKALELAPGNAIVRLKYAELLLRLGLLDQAQLELQRAAKLTAPDDTTRDYIRSLLLMVRKEMKRAVVRRSASPLEFWQKLTGAVRGVDVSGKTRQLRGSGARV